MDGPTLGLSTGCLVPGDGRVARTFAIAADLGVDGVEVICDRSPDSRDADGLRALIERHGIPLLALHSPFSSWTQLEGWQDGHVAHVEQTARLAQAVRAAHVVLHVPDRMWFTRLGPLKLALPWPSPHGRAVRRWMDAGGLEALEDATGVQVCVENMPRGPFPMRWRLTGAMREWLAGHRNLALDTTHWATYGVPPLDAYDRAEERVRHVHLSDFAEGRQHRIPGRGDVALRPLLERLRDDRFAGQVVIELTPDALGRDESRHEELIGEAVAYCRAGLGQG
jgi:sugar phosphate isomerase/epimerase